MEDDFYDPVDPISSVNSAGLLSTVLSSVVAAPLAVTFTLLLAPFLIAAATRLLSGRSSEKVNGKDGKTVWMPAYWVPVVGHAFQL